MHDAEMEEMSASGLRDLRGLVFEFEDIFRIRLWEVGIRARVPPMEIKPQTGIKASTKAKLGHLSQKSQRDFQ